MDRDDLYLAITFIFIVIVSLLYIKCAEANQTRIIQEQVNGDSLLFNKGMEVYCEEEPLKIGESKVFCSGCHKLTRISEKYCKLQPLKMIDDPVQSPAEGLKK